MADQHRITPPPELVEQWAKQMLSLDGQGGELAVDLDWFATQAARWGADQELEACCILLNGASIVPPDSTTTYPEDVIAARKRVAKLRAARRPKPKSLAEEALAEIQMMEGAMYSADLGCDFTATRRALERLQELEGQQ